VWDEVVEVLAEGIDEDGRGAGGGELSSTQFEQEGEGNEGERRAQG